MLQLRFEFADGGKLMLATGPLCGQSWGGPIRQPWSLHLLIWSISTWFLTTMYTTVLQSLVVIPEVKSGDLTLDSILDQNLTVFANRAEMAKI